MGTLPAKYYAVSKIEDQVLDGTELGSLGQFRGCQLSVGFCNRCDPVERFRASQRCFLIMQELCTRHLSFIVQQVNFVRGQCSRVLTLAYMKRSVPQ